MKFSEIDKGHLGSYITSLHPDGGSNSCIEVQVAIPIIPDIFRKRRIGSSPPSLVGDLERQYKKYFLTRSRRMKFYFNGGET